MNTEFEDWGTGDFNCVMDTDLKKNMTFQQAVDEIEKAEVNYFYVSMCEEDVLEAVENEKDIAGYDSPEHSYGYQWWGHKGY